MRRIGIRELRQRASEYIRLVEEGETVEVTDRGRPVAMITPIRRDESTVERLIREGRLSPGKGRLLDVKPLPPLKDGPTLSEVLAGMRADER